MVFYFWYIYYNRPPFVFLLILHYTWFVYAKHLSYLNDLFWFRLLSLKQGQTIRLNFVIISRCKLLYVFKLVRYVVIKFHHAFYKFYRFYIRRWQFNCIYRSLNLYLSQKYYFDLRCDCIYYLLDINCCGWGTFSLFFGYRFCFI